ncbi:MAG: AAA family ATPase, partial [bacterium]
MKASEVKSSAFELAERFINHTNRHVFLTGKAGTGKTTFLKYITQKTHKKTIIAAPTGIAALNAGGVTLHSQFQLPLASFIPTKQEFHTHLNANFETQSTILRHLRMSNDKRSIIREAELLIIDEVSMLRADILDAIDHILKYIRRNQKSFGGLQVLFIGDMMQLPPIVKDSEWDVLSKYYSNIFFFNAKVLEKDKPVYIELDTIYRQSDKIFTDILNKIRYNELTENDINYLNTFYKQHIPDNLSEYITLTTHNARADSINKEELNKIKSQSFFYEAKINNDFPDHIIPNEKKLELKLGAQVMFLKNDHSSSKQYYNGKIGTVHELTKESIKVKIDDNVIIDVKPYDWENIKYSVDDVSKEIKEEIIGSYTQYPLKLAWAITIHKSQGLTFDKAIIDVKNVFTSGQSYVAFSRLRNLEGLILSSPFTSNIIKHNETIVDYEKNRLATDIAYDILMEESWQYISDYNKLAFDFHSVYTALNKHIDSIKKEDVVYEILKDSSLKIFFDFQKELEIADKFKLQLQNLFFVKDINTLYVRLNDAKNYFEKNLKEICLHIKSQIEVLAKLKKVKAFITELEELESLIFQKIQHINKSCHIVEAYLFKKELSKLDIKNSLNIEWRESNIKVVKVEKFKAEKRKVVKGDSVLETFELYNKGFSIEDIAATRGLKKVTIYSHINELIARNEIKIEDVMTLDRIQPIKECIKLNDQKSLT